MPIDPHEIPATTLLRDLCRAVRTGLNDRLRTPGTILAIGDVKRLQTLFDMSSDVETLLKKLENLDSLES